MKNDKVTFESVEHASDIYQAEGAMGIRACLFLYGVIETKIEIGDEIEQQFPDRKYAMTYTFDNPQAPPRSVTLVAPKDPNNSSFWVYGHPTRNPWDPAPADFFAKFPDNGTALMAALTYLLREGDMSSPDYLKVSARRRGTQ